MWVLLTAAYAQPSDVSVTSFGIQSWSDSALRGAGTGSSDGRAGGATDVDFLVGERLRWTLLGDLREEGPDLLALADVRFTLDPVGGPPFEWSAVRQLGLQYVSRRWTLDVGRSAVYRGGPRLVDGAQVLFSPARAWKLGGWGGLVPDLFSTLPRIRPGGGPIVAYESSSTQASVVGEYSTFDGATDRLALLAQARHSIEQNVDLSGRLDVDLAGTLGPRLVDGMVTAGFDPHPAWSFQATYDAFSSYQYNQSEALDPDLLRFADRLGDLGVSLGLTQDRRDPTVFQLFAFNGRYRDNGGAGLIAGLDARYRYHVEPADRYMRVHPQVGFTSLAGGTLDVRLDGNWIAVEQGTPCDRAIGEDEPAQGCGQLDGGLLVWWEPGNGTLAFDGSARLISAPDDLPSLGWYGDLYVNVVSEPLDLIFIGGAMVLSETDPLVTGQRSVGIGLFGRVAKYLR